MSYKEQLVKFIDAVVAGDEPGQKNAYSAYIQGKSRELLGQPPVETPVNEVWLDRARGIELVGKDDVILLKGERIGRIVHKNESGEEIPHERRGDEASALAKAYFKMDDGHTVTMDDMDPSKLVTYIARKYLGEKI